jgi:hypothetical protein
MSIAHLLSFWTFPTSGEARLSTIKLKAMTHVVFLYENSKNQNVQGDFLCKKKGRKEDNYFVLKKIYFPFFPGEARASAPQRSDATARLRVHARKLVYKIASILNPLIK